MGSDRIQLTGTKGEPAPPNVFADLMWFHDHRESLLEQYGEAIVLVFEAKVVGIGETIEAAAIDAEKKLAPNIANITPVIGILRHENPLLLQLLRTAHS